MGDSRGDQRKGMESKLAFFGLLGLFYSFASRNLLKSSDSIEFMEKQAFLAWLYFIFDQKRQYWVKLGG